MAVHAGSAIPEAWMPYQVRHDAFRGVLPFLLWVVGFIKCAQILIL